MVTAEQLGVVFGEVKDAATLSESLTSDEKNGLLRDYIAALGAVPVDADKARLSEIVGRLRELPVSPHDGVSGLIAIHDLFVRLI